jgi:peptide/nickel transport system substrate-binding protein
MWACDKSIEPMPFDPEEAERILQSKGWAKNGKGFLEKEGKTFEFFISWNSGNEIRQKVAELVQANLREIGVEVKPRPLDFNVWSENLKRGVEDSWVGVWWVATKVDEKPTFHSSSIGDGFNYGRWRNARVDQIIDTARVEPDAEKARKLWNEFQAIFREEQPYTLLWEPMALNALHKRFTNVEINSLDVYDNLPEWIVTGSAR